METKEEGALLGKAGRGRGGFSGGFRKSEKQNKKPQTPP